MNPTVVFRDRREGYYPELIRRYGPNYAGFDLTTIELVLNVFFTYDVLHQCTSKYLAEFGLSKSSLNILMLLRHGPPEGMQLHDLGEMLLVSRANITGLIGHLEERGYVTREVGEQDRRARYARATQKAEGLLNELMPVHYSNINLLMSGLSEPAKNELVGLLTRVRESIHQHGDVCEQTVGVKG